MPKGVRAVFSRFFEKKLSKKLLQTILKKYFRDVLERGVGETSRKKFPPQISLLPVNQLQVVLFDEALELLAASGARELLGVDGFVKADNLAASGALYFKVIVAITVAIALAVTVIAIAVTIVTIAITVAVVLLIEVLLDLTQILIDLLDVIVERVDLLLLIGSSLCELVAKVDQSGNELALLGGLIEIKAIAKALDISGFFGQIHDPISFFV